MSVSVNTVSTAACQAWQRPAAATDGAAAYVQSEPLSDRVTLSAEGKAAGRSLTAHAQARAAFEDELAQRLKSAKGEDGERRSDEEQAMLMRAINGAVDAIDKELGRDAAKAAMSNILMATEERGFTAADIASAVGEAMNGKVKMPSSQNAQDGFTYLKQLKNYKNDVDARQRVAEDLNKDDNLAFAANAEEAEKAASDGSKAVGLSYALNRFFGREAEEKNDGLNQAKASRMDADGAWGRGRISNDFESRKLEAEANVNKPIKDFKVFTSEELGAGAVNSVIEAITRDLGAKAGEFARDRLEDSRDFIGAVDEVLAHVGANYGFEATEKVMKHLNSGVKSAINGNDKLVTLRDESRVRFEGWSVAKSYGTDAKSMQAASQNGPGVGGISCHWSDPKSGGRIYHQTSVGNAN